MLNSKRILISTLTGFVLVFGGAVAARAALGGEAPEPADAPPEIVVGESEWVSEESLLLSSRIEAALAGEEADAATQRLRDIESALEQPSLRLISSDTEMITTDHLREEAIYLLPGESVLTIWWQEVDPEWDLSRMMTDGAALFGWPTGTTATVIEARGHVQVLFSNGDILGSVVVEKPVGVRGARPELSAAEAVELAIRVFRSLTNG
jgi:hypothetical protein